MPGVASCGACHVAHARVQGGHAGQTYAGRCHHSAAGHQFCHCAGSNKNPNTATMWRCPDPHLDGVLGSPLEPEQPSDQRHHEQLEELLARQRLKAPHLDGAGEEHAELLAVAGACRCGMCTGSVYVSRWRATQVLGTALLGTGAYECLVAPTHACMRHIPDSQSDIHTKAPGNLLPNTHVSSCKLPRAQTHANGNVPGCPLTSSLLARNPHHPLLSSNAGGAHEAGRGGVGAICGPPAQATWQL